MASFRIHALPRDVLAQVRSTGLDASRNPIEQIEADGGEPLRCCLRDARRGERIVLFGYAAPIPETSPYREIGAVFAHAAACPGAVSGETYPDEWRTRSQVLRAYDRRGWIRDAVVHEPGEAEPAIAKLLADPDVVELHSRNVAYGCFMFRVTRD
jgi:hypothetical protein